MLWIFGNRLTLLAINILLWLLFSHNLSILSYNILSFVDDVVSWLFLLGRMTKPSIWLLFFLVDFSMRLRALIWCLITKVVIIILIVSTKLTPRVIDCNRLLLLNGVVHHRLRWDYTRFPWPISWLLWRWLKFFSSILRSWGITSIIFPSFSRVRFSRPRIIGMIDLYRLSFLNLLLDECIFDRYTIDAARSYRALVITTKFRRAPKPCTTVLHTRRNWCIGYCYPGRNNRLIISLELITLCPPF